MMAEKHPKRPRDLNQWAKYMVDLATGEKTETQDEKAGSQPESESDRLTSSEFARRGGLKGGRARAAKLSPKVRADIARKAAAARWRKDDGGSSGSQ